MRRDGIDATSLKPYSDTLLPISYGAKILQIKRIQRRPKRTRRRRQGAQNNTIIFFTPDFLIAFTKSRKKGAKRVLNIKQACRNCGGVEVFPPDPECIV